MSRVRRHLTFENILVTAVAFVVLAGGTAFAANELAKNSVGKAQLKANAVTTAKIKKNAVTRAKIKNGAIDGTKVKSGGLGAADFQLDGMPYTRIASEIRIKTDIGVSTASEPNIVSLPSASYTQEAGRIDRYLGAVDVEFSSGCGAERGATAYLLADAPAGAKFDISILSYAVALGSVSDEGGGQATRRINLGPYLLGARFAPNSSQSHTFSVLLGGGCETGSGITAKSFSIDVIGTKTQ